MPRGNKLGKCYCSTCRRWLIRWQFTGTTKIIKFCQKCDKSTFLMYLEDFNIARSEAKMFINCDTCDMAYRDDDIIGHPHIIDADTGIKSAKDLVEHLKTELHRDNWNKIHEEARNIYAGYEPLKHDFVLL